MIKKLKLSCFIAKPSDKNRFRNLKMKILNLNLFLVPGYNTMFQINLKQKDMNTILSSIYVFIASQNSTVGEEKANQRPPR